MTKALDVAVRKGREILSFRQNASALIERTKREIVEQESRLAELKRDLALEEARVALGETVLQSGVEASIAKTVSQIERLRARITGLEASLQNDDEVLAAEQSLSQALGDDISKRVADYEAEYLAAAEQFANVRRRGRALADALGRQFIGVDKSQIFEPFGMRLVAELTAPQYDPRTGYAYPAVRSKGDQQLFEEISSLQTILDSLRHQRNRIQREQHERRQAGLTATADQRPKSSSVPEFGSANEKLQRKLVDQQQNDRSGYAPAAVRPRIIESAFMRGEKEPA